MFPIFNHPSIGITPDDSWCTLKFGDRARVRAHIPIYGERVGTLTEITDGMYHLAFDGGGSCVFDGDDLMAVKKQEEQKEQA